MLVLTMGLTIAPVAAANDLHVAPAVADMRAYHLGVGKLDGTLGLGSSGADDSTTRMIAQAAAPPVTGSTEPEEAEDSASELNRKLTNPVSTI